jgi:sterol desaturase/sphingolipid hydroxylase (fatty acid hydroxylase superfamily)
MTLAELFPILQMAIAPTTLVSGVGLLLLCMSQRFATVVERARSIALSASVPAGSGRADARRQLYVLSQRARFLRGCVGTAAGSVLLAVLLMVVLVMGSVANVDVAPAAVGLLIACLLTLLLSLGLFLLDVNLSLNALWIELPRGFALPEERAVLRPRRRPARLPLNV